MTKREWTFITTSRINTKWFTRDTLNAVGAAAGVDEVVRDVVVVVRTLNQIIKWMTRKKRRPLTHRSRKR